MKKDLNIYSKMSPKLIAQGAEAKILLTENIRHDSNSKEGSIKENLVSFITKDRISKSYRIPELDKKIRKSRTKAETKLLHKASQVINVPLPEISEETNKIIMPYIDGQKLSDHLDKFPLLKQKQIYKQIGEDVAKLHDAEIIHGDLTTSNMILVEDKDKIDVKNKLVDKNSKDGVKLIKRAAVGDGGGLTIFFIDFGLGYISHKYEDKAVDIHLFTQALEAKHFRNWETLFSEFEKGYNTSKDAKTVFERLKAVEKRGRYKH
jgi:TP53 regulating kinase-like protein